MNGSIVPEILFDGLEEIELYIRRAFVSSQQRKLKGKCQLRVKSMLGLEPFDSTRQLANGLFETFVYEPRPRTVRYAVCWQLYQLRLSPSS